MGADRCGTAPERAGRCMTPGGMGRPLFRLSPRARLMHWLTAAWEALVRQEEPYPTAGPRIAAALAGAVLVLWVVGRGDLSDPPDRTATVVIIVWAALVDMLLWLGWRLAARGRRNAGAILCAVATVLVFLLAVLLGL